MVLAMSLPDVSTVQAQSLSAKTFTDCPTFSELRTAILHDRIVIFDLEKECTVSFEEEILIGGFAIIRNIGEGKLTFDGNNNDGDADNDTNFFSVSGGGLELVNLTLANGKTILGGAISVYSGSMKLDRVVLRNNKANAQGGAIYFAGGDIDIRNSYFYANATTEEPTGTTGDGGAIYASNFGQTSRVFLLNTTFEQNKTGDSLFDGSGRGGAIYVYDVYGALLVNIFNSTFYRNSTGNSPNGDVGDGGAIYANNFDGAASLNIYHSTFSGNATGSTFTGTPGDGQTIYLRESSLNMAGSILANSRSSFGGAGEDCDFRGDVSISDGGYNLIESMGSCLDYFPRSTELDPGLETGLANHGGDTKTVALLTNSPAVDQIPFDASFQGINLCGFDYADFDQRGEPRPGNDRCDIGAYEIADEDHPHVLPYTGFPQGFLTELNSPEILYSALGADSGGLQLVIPVLDVNAQIVGVPETHGEWQVEWLGSDVGYLEGTTFPTWQGNSVLTGHAYNHLGQPGVFADLDQLRYNDTITIQAWGQKYVYAVRVRYVTSENDLAVMDHSDQTQLTLITCTGYDAENQVYPQRLVIVAVLVSVH